MDLIEYVSNSSQKHNFIIGTGTNSLLDTANLINHSKKLGFKNFLIMPGKETLDMALKLILKV